MKPTVYAEEIEALELQIVKARLDEIYLKNKEQTTKNLREINLLAQELMLADCGWEIFKHIGHNIPYLLYEKIFGFMLRGYDGNIITLEILFTGEEYKFFTITSVYTQQVLNILADQLSETFNVEITLEIYRYMGIDFRIREEQTVGIVIGKRKDK